MIVPDFLSFDVGYTENQKIQLYAPRTIYIELIADESTRRLANREYVQCMYPSRTFYIGLIAERVQGDLLIGSMYVVRYMYPSRTFGLLAESTRRLANREYVRCMYVHNKLLYHANILQYVSGFRLRCGV